MYNSLLAQMVKNLSALQETWVQSLGWEDPLEKGTATHSRIYSMDRGAQQATAPKIAELDTTERLTLSLSQFYSVCAC